MVSMHKRPQLKTGSFWVLKERHQSCDGMRDAYIFIVNDMEPTYSEVH